MSEIQLHEDLDQLLDLVATSKGSTDIGVGFVASSCTTSSTCTCCSSANVAQAAA